MWPFSQLGKALAGTRPEAIVLRSEHALAAGPVEVDREAGTLRGVSIITSGQPIGHPFQVDEVMMKQVADGINAKKGGLKVRLQHDLGGMFGWRGDEEGITKLIGNATGAAVDGEQVRADIQFGKYAKSSPRGDLWAYLFDLAEDEAMRGQVGLSIRFEPDDFEEMKDPDSGMVLPPAGRVKEMLSVDFTDDPGANPGGMLSRNTASISEEDGAMNEALRKYLGSIGLKAEATEDEAQTFLSGLKDDQKAIAEALSAGEKAPAAAKPPTPAPDPEKAKVPPQQPAPAEELAAKRTAEAVLAAERSRVKELHGIGDQCRLGADWTEKHVMDGTSVEAARKDALEQVAKLQQPLPLGAIQGIRVGADRNRDTLGDAITDAILLRAGVHFYEEEADIRRITLGADRKPVARQPHERTREFRSLSLVEMGRAWLQAIGIPDAQSLGRTQVAELVLSRNRLRQRYGVIALAQSTSDFPYLLEDAMGKSLRAAYVEAPSTWALWARRSTAPDFKEIKRVSLGEAGALVARAEGGEIQYVTLAGGREVYALAEYASGIKLTRQAIINDDLDAFARVPQLQANAARRKEDDVCYAVLTGNAALADTVALFHATHANLAGTGGAPAVATLNAARAAMRIQTGPGGAILNITPKFILSPAALEGTVKQLLVSEIVPAAAASSGRNIWRGELEPVIESRLDATVDGDTDAKTWYLAADPNQIDTVEVAFLEDEQEPQLKQETEFDTGDRKYAVTHVVASKAIDYRGLYKNKGD